MLRATLIPIITPSYTANPWSTIFMNEPNLDVACGGGVNFNEVRTFFYLAFYFSLTSTDFL